MLVVNTNLVTVHLFCLQSPPTTTQNILRPDSDHLCLHRVSDNQLFLFTLIISYYRQVRENNSRHALAFKQFSSPHMLD